MYAAIAVAPAVNIAIVASTRMARTVAKSMRQTGADREK